MQWFEDMKQWILDHAPSHPASLGADQIVNTSEPPQVPQVEVYVPPEYDQISNDNYGTSNFGSVEPPKTPLPEPTYYNNAGLKSDINGNALMNTDRTYTDREGHTIMSDTNGNAIMPQDAPQYYDWYTPAGTLGADQTVNNEAVLPSQETQNVADKFKYWKAQEDAQKEYQSRKPIAEQFADWQASNNKKAKDTLGDKAANLIYKFGDTITQPAVMALNGISYFDKPRGALAGAVKAAEEGTPILEGAKQGWQNNTSWKDTFPEQFQKNNPYYAASILGLGADVIADPLWLVPPAKIASIVGKGSKAVGLTDKIAPVANKITNSETGQKAIAWAEDFAGKNRIADDINDMKAAHAGDIVQTQANVMPELQALKKQYGDQADNLTNYIEAAQRPDNSVLKKDGSYEYLSSLEKQKTDLVNDMVDYFKSNPGGNGVQQGSLIRDEMGDVVGRVGRQSKNPQWYQDFWKEYGHAPTQSTLKEFAEKELSKYPESGYDDLVEEINNTKQQVNSLGNDKKISSIIDSVKNGTAPEQIKQGVFSKDDALNALRGSGEDVPDYLLQDAQKYAKEAGQEIPDTVYRDQVLSQIQDEKLRNSIQRIGDKFIDINKQMSDKLGEKGLLSDEQMIRFDNGSHLRRSFEQYENPQQFLEAVRKNGTPEEYRQVYKALDRTAAHGSQGYSQTHKVNMQDFVGRQNLSDETMQKLGLITDPEYRIMDTIKRGSKDLRESEFLDQIAAKWGKTDVEAADLSRTLTERRRYTQMPESESYGALAGKWVPKDIADQVIKVTGNKEEYAKMLQKTVSYWKAGKLVNPASIARNFYSGIPMANVFGGVPIQSMPKYMAKATQAFTQKYKSSLYKEAKGTGVFDNEWTKQELQNIIGESPKGVKKYLDIGMKAFGAPDQFWRMVTYSYQRDHGKSIKEAAQIANNALFDYSNAPPIIDAAAKYGIVPFAKFPYYAAKETGKALYNNPAKVTKYTKAQNQDNSDDKQKIMPEYMQAKTLLPIGDGSRIVNGKPQAVQNNIDLSYVLPFANDISFGNPLVDVAQLYRTGKNALGMDVIKPYMTGGDKAKEYFKFGWDSLAPALLSSYNAGKIKDAYYGNVDEKGRQYDMASALGQVFAGIKNVPINNEEMANSKIKRLGYLINQTQGEINRIKSGKVPNLNNEQKNQMINQYKKQLDNMKQEVIDTREAYKRIKGRN